jgi:tetratricopeptide (TPR) repeat protein
MDARDEERAMSDPSLCPDREVLKRLLLGELSEEETQALEGHVARCPRCLEVVRDVRAEDALVEAVRAGGQAEDISPEGLDARLIARLCRLPRGTRQTVSLSEDSPETPPPPTSLAPADWAEDLSGVLAPPAEPDEFGRLGLYGILRVLGRGGTGVVFAARQDRPRRLVALKMILCGPWGGGQLPERFRGESELLARLRHPHIVQVYEVGEHQGRPYFTMEYADGGSLAQRLAAAPLAPRPAAELLAALAGAVQAAHEQGIVHRDLKPSNVLLAADGTPRVGDFGLAKQVNAAPGLGPPGGWTQTGAILGTPGYMAPEQAAGQSKDVGPAADVYALGAILYECLTGRPPFKAASVLETLEQVRLQEPVPPSRLNPKVPRDLQTVCLKCLEKEPARRYGSAREVADDLGRFLRGEPIRARPVALRVRLWKWARRRPAAAALLAVSGLFVLAAAAGVAGHNAQLQAALADARQQRERADRNSRNARDTLEKMLSRLEERSPTDSPWVMELGHQQRVDALAFYQQIASEEREYPDPPVRLDAAKAYAQTASLQQYLGQATDAAENYGRAIALLEGLPAEHRDATENQTRLAGYNHTLGNLASEAGRHEEAVRYHRKALDLREKLAGANPDDPERQADVAESESRLAAADRASGRLAPAEAHFDRAVAILSRLVRTSPRNATYRTALAKDYVTLSQIYAATGRRDEAALPPVAASTLGLLGSPCGGAPLLAASALVPGRIDKANTARRQADEALLVRPAGGRPDQPVGEAAAILMHLQGGKLLKEAGATRAALESLDRAVGLAEALLRRDPRNPAARTGAVAAHAERADICAGLGRWTEAVDDWDHAIERAADLGSPPPGASISAKDWDRLHQVVAGPALMAFRVERVGCLACAGAHARAAVEAGALEADGKSLQDLLSGLAVVYAQCVKSARSDPRLPDREKGALADGYGSRAVALLRRLEGQGYFKQADHAAGLRDNLLLRPLRDRDDFKALLRQVQGGKGR